MEEGDSSILEAAAYLREMAEGRGFSDVECLILQGLQLLHAGRGILRCTLPLSDRLSDGDGNWNVGAIAAAMDTVGAAAVYSDGDGPHVSVDFNSSFYSTVKIQEEIEIEARVVGRNGGLKSVEMEIRRKCKGDLIARGRLWMSPLTLIKPRL